MIRTVTSHRRRPAEQRRVRCRTGTPVHAARAELRRAAVHAVAGRLQRAVPGPECLRAAELHLRPATGRVPDLPSAQQVCGGGARAVLRHLRLHNFYLGYTGKGVAQVLISVLTFGIGAIAVMIWAIVEAIQILTADYGTEHHRDARGVELQD